VRLFFASYASLSTTSWRRVKGACAIAWHHGLVPGEPDACREHKFRPAYAFVKLRSAHLVPVFKAVMEGTPWPGNDGESYRCEVALALFQKVPRASKKADPKAGTYESGECFRCI
jgi:Smg-4/UPF3 family